MKKVTLSVIAFDDIEAKSIARAMAASEFNEMGCYITASGHVTNLSDGDKFKIINSIKDTGDLILINEEIKGDLYVIARAKIVDMYKSNGISSYQIVINHKIYNFDDEDERDVEYKVLLELLPNLKK